MELIPVFAYTSREVALLLREVIDEGIGGVVLEELGVVADGSTSKSEVVDT